MNNELNPYECQFTVDERKKIIAQILESIRKNKGYSQKQVAAFIKIKPTTYNTYESGRTEPPAEILVRLSYLYQIPVDMLVQKDRLYRGTLDIEKQLDEYKKQVSLLDKKITENDGDNPTVKALQTAANFLIDTMKAMNQNHEIQQKVEKPLDK